ERAEGPPPAPTPRAPVKKKKKTKILWLLSLIFVIVPARAISPKKNSLLKIITCPPTQKFFVMLWGRGL
ncbi:hypothetical protein ACVGXN_01730, partial [Enterobacter hormaechei]